MQIHNHPSSTITPISITMAAWMDGRTDARMDSRFHAGIGEAANLTECVGGTRRVGGNYSAEKTPPPLCL